MGAAQAELVVEVCYDHFSATVSATARACLPGARQVAEAVHDGSVKQKRGI